MNYHRAIRLVMKPKLFTVRWNIIETGQKQRVQVKEQKIQFKSTSMEKSVREMSHQFSQPSVSFHLTGFFV